MALDYSKWDKTYKVTEEEVKELDNNGGRKEYEDVPFGQYEIEVASLELASSKKGDPMLKGRFKILSGKYKGNSIFYNQIITQSFQIHNANEFLRSLDSGKDVQWLGTYSSYADVVETVFEAIKGKLEYGLDYHSDNKGYPVFEIMEVYEKE